MHDFFEISITNLEAKKIQKELFQITYDPMGSSAYISQIRTTAYRVLPAKLIDLLEQQKSSKTPMPFIIFNNLPLDDEIKGSPTAGQSGVHFKSGTLSENVLCAIGAVLGEPYSIQFEGHELVNNLTPQEDTKNEYTGLGSEVELDFHIENSALKHMSEDDCSPSGLLLLGIREDIQGPMTLVSDSRKALQLLSPADIDVLYGNNFIIRLPYRWRNAFSGICSENTELCPMISGPLDLPRLSPVFYPDMVLPINSRAHSAFNNLYQAVKKVSVGLKITPGKLIFIDNRFALHAREKFSPTYDKQGFPYRWVQRLFITQSLWSFRSFPQVGERVFNPGAISISS